MMCHAYQGGRNVLLTANGVDDELMKWHSMLPPKNNVHFFRGDSVPGSCLCGIVSTGALSVRGPGIMDLVQRKK